MSNQTLHNILVRDFTDDQKKAVEQAADREQISTSKYIRNAAVKAAGGKLDGDAPKKKPGRKPGAAKVAAPARKAGRGIFSAQRQRR